MLVIIENLQNVEKEKEKPSSCLVHYFLLLFPRHLGSFWIAMFMPYTHFFLFKFIILTYFFITHSCNIFNGHKICYQVAMSQFNR